MFHSLIREYAIIIVDVEKDGFCIGIYVACDGRIIVLCTTAYLFVHGVKVPLITEVGRW